MTTEPKEERSTFQSKLKGALKTLGVVAAVIVVVWAISSATGVVGQTLGSPRVMAWLDAPISQMKTWHLLLILWFIGAITRDK